MPGITTALTAVQLILRKLEYGDPSHTNRVSQLWYISHSFSGITLLFRLFSLIIHAQMYDRHQYIPKCTTCTNTYPNVAHTPIHTQMYHMHQHIPKCTTDTKAYLNVTQTPHTQMYHRCQHIPKCTTYTHMYHRHQHILKCTTYTKTNPNVPHTPMHTLM